MTATVHVLTVGYVGPKTASTVTLIRDGAAQVVVDPGMVADRDLILGPLRELGVAPEDVTDVVFSHHHPDHTLNAALFPNARFHDHWAIYQNDDWDDRDADGYQLSDHVRLMRTPGHTPEDISTLVATEEGLVVLTHLWWSAEGPAEDPYATDGEQLHRHRETVLASEPVLIVPAHGASFAPSGQTPR
ncbi:MBL fold metallo-hydrolase [Catenulispora subtropica]|uniref:Metallo-beta-lactamase domain-containing protein 1 n=1 Tax=Catenulispora subtropica TaxID=450798 RepID=A0ABP5ERV2_9ACTN